MHAQSIPVPNFSFESPNVPFAQQGISSWQETPKPAGYMDSSGFTWAELAGTFANTASGASDHIDNLDGIQAAYVFAVPQVGFFQDYNSTDYQGLPPTHAFDVSYAIGESYTLTVALNGGGGNMVPGASLLLSLYYLDDTGSQVTVAGTTVVYTAALFPTHTTMTDFQVHVPVVKPGDSWAGKHLGISLYSTVDASMEGGYWDVDNIRLSTSPGSPVPLSIVKSTSTAIVSWPTATGYQYQLQTSLDLHSWAPYGGPAPGTGNPATTQYPIGGPEVFFRLQITAIP